MSKNYCISLKWLLYVWNKVYFIALYASARKIVVRRFLNRICRFFYRFAYMSRLDSRGPRRFFLYPWWNRRRTKWRTQWLTGEKSGEELGEGVIGKNGVGWVKFSGDGIEDSCKPQSLLSHSRPLNWLSHDCVHVPRLLTRAPSAQSVFTGFIDRRMRDADSLRSRDASPSWLRLSYTRMGK